MSSAADKIRELSKKAAAEKIEKQQKDVENSVNKDIEVIEKILEMVKDRLIYKEYTPANSRRKTYVIVTEDIVLEDYSNPPQYGSGTSIKHVGSDFYTYEHIAINVNGHKYYHAADLITKYRFDAKRAVEKAEAELKAANDRKYYLENMANLEPVLKDLMINHSKHLGLIKADDEE